MMSRRRFTQVNYFSIFFLTGYLNLLFCLFNISKPFLGSIRTTISRLLLRAGLVSFILRGARR